MDQRGVRVYGVGARPQSQYLRSVAARVLGLGDGEYDWAVVVRKQLLRATVHTLGPLVGDLAVLPDHA